jgi:5-methylcytosine-specific restriction protein B
MNTSSHAERVREYARRHYVEPARQRGDSTVQIVAGEVEKAVHLTNRTPLVCQALRSGKFLAQNHLVLEKWEGPKSGLSTTVRFFYRLTNEPGQSSSHAKQSPFLRLRGIAKDVFQELGGGEAFIQAERASWESRGDS